MDKNSTLKQDNLFDLVKSLSKAEKRGFKLYALRQSGNVDANFISLFEIIDLMSEYDEVKILKKTSIDKRQLPNTKAHLYRQILISLRLINSRHNISIELREQIDFARVLYDKGFYKQSLKILDKAKRIALSYHQVTTALEIVEFEKSIEILHITHSDASRAEQLSRQTSELCALIENANDLSNISIQLYSLYLKLGYVRSERDLQLVRSFFKPKLDKYTKQDLRFLEQINFYQAQMWYAYIQYNFLLCYKYSQKLLRLLDSNKQMLPLYYDIYLRSYSRSMEMLFLMKDYKRLVKSVEEYSKFQYHDFGPYNQTVILARLPYYFNKINIHFLEGSFEEGIEEIPQIIAFLKLHDTSIDYHYKLLIYYKIACLYFGGERYTDAITYLQMIISSKDGKVRLDLQCFARILNLIASYEANLDYNIDYQIRSVYSYIIRMNDMHSAQKEIIQFLKKLNSYYASEFKSELKKLYEKLKPLETHPYERRPFFYLDIISWLESKIKGVKVSEIIQQKFADEHAKREK